MAKQVWAAALSSLVVLLVTIGGRYLEERMLEDKGRVVIAQPLTISGSLFTEMDVENWSTETFNGLVLVVPNSVSASLITSSTPLMIEEAKGITGAAQTLRHLTFSGLPPRRTTRVMIPLSSASDLQQFSLPNATELKYGVDWYDAPQDPWEPTLRELTMMPIAYAVLYGVVTYFFIGYFQSTLDKSKKEREEEGKKLEDFKVDLEKRNTDWTARDEKLKHQLADVLTRQARYRVYLLSRISHYSRELEFWRNTARRIILSGGLGKESAEAFVEKVTTTLKTWGTKGTASDFDTILETARMLTNEGKTTEWKGGRCPNRTPVPTGAI